ncbi:MAG: hypothetical protein LC799_20730 [Actinobacteria bacterium]|nr:hypothetical protein [Actinomycetota bacterium]
MLPGRSRRWILGSASAVAAVLATTSQAWSCASLAAVEVNPNVVRPGQEVPVKVTFVNKDKPVTLRWNTLDGPVLATIEPATFTEGLHGNWRFAQANVRIPADATPGNYLMIANQEAVKGTNTWGIPARTLVQVSDGRPLVGAPVGPPIVDRPNTLVTEESLSGGDLLVVGLGAAGITMLLAGIGIILAAGRRAPAAATVPGAGAGAGRQ